MAQNAGPAPDAGLPRNTDGTVKLVSMEAMTHNATAVQGVHTKMAIVAGVAAGVLGLTSVSGFLLYLASHLCVAFALWHRAAYDTEAYFSTPTHTFFMRGFTGQLSSFLLFWTFAYALVHLY